MKRFLYSDMLCTIRSRQREGIKLLTHLQELATNSLGDAGRIHAQIEQIYVKYMDFDRLDGFFEAFVASVSL